MGRLQLELKDCGAEGRGLVASTRIKKGQRIVQVPSQTAITPEAKTLNSHEAQRAKKPNHVL
eukprot:1159841-Pelagomonas_calceolata.AAC.1